jgi:polyphosphate kinase
VDIKVRADKRDRSRKDKSNATTAAKEPGMGAESISGNDYEKHLARLQGELVQLQLWVQDKGLKVCVLFEGRDGAGNGGTIKALTDARGFSAWSRCRRVRKARCMHSAASRTFRPPGKS